jgi:hypothetical protein
MSIRSREGKPLKRDCATHVAEATTTSPVAALTATTDQVAKAIGLATRIKTIARTICFILFKLQCDGGEI